MSFWNLQFRSPPCSPCLRGKNLSDSVVNPPAESMSRQIFISGKFYPQEDAKISVFDHGLLYGDGVFEGLRAYNGKVFRLDEHVTRLYESAKAIWLTIPMSQDEMSAAVN